MPTYTPTTSSNPSYGQTGESVAALQTQLNQTNQGKPGYVPLVVDSKYGPKTQAAFNFGKTSNLMNSSSKSRSSANAAITEHTMNMNLLGGQNTPTTQGDNSGNDGAAKDINSANYSDPTTQSLDRIAKQSDSATKALIATIQAQRQSGTNALDKTYDNYKRGLQGLGIQTNSAQATPDLLQGHIVQAEEAHQQKLTDLNVKINKTMMDAQTAATNKDYKIVAEKNKYIKDLKKQQSDVLKNFASQLTAQKSVSTNIASLIYDNIQKLPPDQKENFIQEVSNKYGIAPVALITAISKEQVARNKAAGKGAKGSASTLKGAISTVAPQIDSIKGEDGYIDPAKYIIARDKWNAAGFSTSSFESNFKRYVNPKSYAKVGFKKTSSGRSS